MKTRWDPASQKYGIIVYKYETDHKTKEYHKADEAWNKENEGVQWNKRTPRPDYHSFDVVREHKINGDTVESFVRHYPSNEERDKWSYRHLNDQEVADAVLTPTNCEFGVRDAQSAAFKRLGYHGPIGGGEARALRNLFTEMGRSELVRHGYFRVTKKIMRPPSKYQIRRAQWNNGPMPPSREVDAEILQHCYVFKSPVPEVPFSKFIKLARMYRGDKGGLRTAVKAVLANPEAHKEVETLDCIDLLGKMVGMD